VKLLQELNYDTSCMEGSVMEKNHFEDDEFLGCSIIYLTEVGR
jgi:hypothetical protein